jgi:hypothetical protein
MLRRVLGVVQRMRYYFLNRIIHRWIHTVQLSVQFLNAIRIVCDVKLSESYVFQSYSFFKSFTFDAMTWKERMLRNCWKNREFIRMSPAVSTKRLFTKTPPHALIVKFVVSARIIPQKLIKKWQKKSATDSHLTRRAIVQPKGTHQFHKSPRQQFAA